MITSRDFDLDGRFKRERREPCSQCGEMTHCDDCWWHCSDTGLFYVWHCLLCKHPMACFGSAARPHRCDNCGWDERTETRSMVWDRAKQDFVDEIGPRPKSVEPPR